MYDIYISMSIYVYVKISLPFFISHMTTFCSSNLLLVVGYRYPLYFSVKLISWRLKEDL